MCYAGKKGVLNLKLKLSCSDKAWIKMGATGYDRCYTDGEKHMGKWGKEVLGRQR